MAAEPAFNPTLVRLRLECEHPVCEGWAPFNPTLVRLRLGASIEEAPIWFTFNPTLVRLRQSRRSASSLSLPAFQSHLGSIAAPAPPGGDTPGLPFQSHLGSIAAWGSSPPGGQHCLPFNPTLVRLRLQRMMGDWCGFATFNPTLVRLRQAVEQPEPEAETAFNPTLVRLRQGSRMRSSHLPGAFNPTLVRLRRGGRSAALVSGRVFQSHLGSIAADYCDGGE